MVRIFSGQENDLDREGSLPQGLLRGTAGLRGFLY